MRAEFRRRFEHRVPLAAIAIGQQRHHHRRHASRAIVRVANIVASIAAVIVAPPRDSLPGRGDCFVGLVFRRTGVTAVRSCTVGSRGRHFPVGHARVHRTTR